jgi:hypothetical protein
MRQSLWKYSIEECDVEDREKLAAYRAMADSWHELLSGDSRHSIGAQFSDMMWQDAAWRVANEARRFTINDGPTAAIAPILGAMIDRGYVAGQVISISRILEFSNSKHPKKGVVSLRRLVDEIRSNRELLTREIYVSQDALPYDWEAVRANEVLIDNGPQLKARWVANEGPEAWLMAMGQHETFDRLADVAPTSRSRHDLINENILDRLEESLKDPVFEEVMKLRNKVVAHAADAFSRSQISDLRMGLQLDEIARAHYLLLGVYQAISSTILFRYWIGSAVPVPQHDQFMHLDSVFVKKDNLKDLRLFWKAHCDERDQWLTDSYEALIR